jgi:hypothetical protein
MFTRRAGLVAIPMGRGCCLTKKRPISSPGRFFFCRTDPDEPDLARCCGPRRPGREPPKTATGAAPLPREIVRASAQRTRLICQECRRCSDGDDRGWRAYRCDVAGEDPEPMLVFLCAACAAREFGPFMSPPSSAGGS